MEYDIANTNGIGIVINKYCEDVNIYGLLVVCIPWNIEFSWILENSVSK